MGNYLLRRLIILLPSLLGISLILFVLLALAPGAQLSRYQLAICQRSLSQPL